jgi:flagellar biosynthesis protein FliR
MPSFLQDAQSLLSPQHVLVLVLTLSRVSGLVMIAPVYGSVEVPVKIRSIGA